MTNLAFDFAARGSARFSPCKRYRYVLERPIGGSGGVLVGCCINPSKADAFDEDQTSRRWKYFARRANASRFLLGNLFAFCETHQDDLCAAYERGEDIIGPENDQVLRELAAQASTIVVAWGSPKWPFVRERIAVVTGILRARGLPLLCLGTTQDGSPRHPSRLGNAVQLEPWREP